MSQTQLTIALAGNPNCGKTTIFNALTGANQHVGNYSGVTVEKRDGSYKHKDQEITVIDLPGTYSLNHHSPEEKVSQDELLSGKINLLVAIVDSGALARSLVFVSQLMQLGLPMILVLNMWDEAEKAGLDLDIDMMSSRLGMPIVKTVGSKRVGIDTLKDVISDESKRKSPTDHLRLGEHTTNAINKIKETFGDAFKTHPDWAATRLLVDDPSFVEAAKNANATKAIDAAKEERTHIEKDTNLPIADYVTEQYYGFANGLLKEVTRKKERADARAMSEKIDKWLAHPVLGLVFFLVIVYVLFQLTFTIGQYPMDWIEGGFEALNEALSGGSFEKDHALLHSLITDGIIGGVGGVLVFLPNIIILFLGLCFLEDTGYMARTAFLLDKIMHKFGLHGRSFIPLITGFGCSVPGIMATRTIAGEKQRLTTMFVLPFMSCGARVPIWLLLVPIFFAPQFQGVAMMGIYLLGVIVALIVALCLRKTVFKGEEEPFVMEMPPYRMPTFRAIMTHMWERAWLYLKKAGTIILLLSIILWGASTFPRLEDTSEENLAKYEDFSLTQAKAEDEDGSLFKAWEAVKKAHEGDEEFELAEAASPLDELIAAEVEKQGLDEEEDADKIDEITENLKTANPALVPEKDQLDQAKAFQTAFDNNMNEKQLENSIMGTVGRAIEPVFKPLGFDWKISTAVLGALAAKEVFVSQMGIVYALGDEVDAEAEIDEETGVSEDEGANSLRTQLRNQYSTLTGICLIIFMLLTSPCIASLAVAKRESNSWKFALAQFFGMFIIAWVLAAVVNLIGHLFT